MKSNVLRINFPWMALCALIVSVFSLTVNVWNARYSTSNTQSSNSTKIQYYVNKTVATADASPSKGSLYVGINQSKGKAGTQYKVQYKTSNSSSWKFTSSTLTATKNDTYYGPNYLFKSTGNQKYNFKINKSNNASTASTITFDWGLK